MKAKDKATESDMQDYGQFALDNRLKVNKHLNRALWMFMLTGPVIAAGIYAGIFHGITYSTCLNISLGVFLMSLAHKGLIKYCPTSMCTSLFVLTALDLLIMYMNYHHVSIYLTWFLVPLLSVLFGNKFIYFYAVVLNYLLMVATTWLVSPYKITLRSDYDDPLWYFVMMISGFTIETIIMATGGYLLGALALDYIRGLFKRNLIIKYQSQEVQEKMEILNSMAEVYEYVNLIDFESNTEMPLMDPRQTRRKIDLDHQLQTAMNTDIKKQVAPWQLDDFNAFTNIQTVRNRLHNRKFISDEFLDIRDGWFRAQYITVKDDENGYPAMVIYTTRSIDEEKKREEKLIKLSITDELTGLLNRRGFEQTMEHYRNTYVERNFVAFSVDVNGLKHANDTKGHAAGDELIKAAADCLVRGVSKSTKIYRTGGDEFFFIAHTEEPNKLKETIKKLASQWKGEYSNSLALSIGYAAYDEYRYATVDNLVHMADANMYADKERYYQENHLERRKNTDSAKRIKTLDLIGGMEEEEE